MSSSFARLRPLDLTRAALALLLLAVLAALVAAPATRADVPAPASAAASDVERLEAATNDLIRAKRAGAERIERLGDAAAGELASCRRSGPGWKRIRRIGHVPQRNLYRVAAARLHADMVELVSERQPRIAVWGEAFERYVDRLQAIGVSHPLLREAVAVQARRLASYREIADVEVGCRRFNRLTRRIRELPTRTPRQIIRADYASGPRARRIERNVSNVLRRIERRAGVLDRDVDTLAAAADVIAAHGAGGWAAGFQYGLSLR